MTNFNTPAQQQELNRQPSALSMYVLGGLASYTQGDGPKAGNMETLVDASTLEYIQPEIEGMAVNEVPSNIVLGEE